MGGVEEREERGRGCGNSVTRSDQLIYTHRAPEQPSSQSNLTGTAGREAAVCRSLLLTRLAGFAAPLGIRQARGACRQHDAVSLIPPRAQQITRLLQDNARHAWTPRTCALPPALTLPGIAEGEATSWSAAWGYDKFPGNRYGRHRGGMVRIFISGSCTSLNSVLHRGMSELQMLSTSAPWGPVPRIARDCATARATHHNLGQDFRARTRPCRPGLRVLWLLRFSRTRVSPLCARTTMARSSSLATCTQIFVLACTSTAEASCTVLTLGV